jgi:hypothetical protein
LNLYLEKENDMSLIELFAIGNGNTGEGLPLVFTLVYALGFVAAVAGGSLAWYNSKRPAGWEGAERPGFVPKIKTGEENEDPAAEDS